MDISKGTINLLRKRLRKQKRRTYLMFIIGLLLGAVIAFNIYYWFPLLKKEFNLTAIPQYPLETENTALTSTSSTESTSTTTESSTNIETGDDKIIPRMTFDNTTKISSNYHNLNQEIEQTINQYNTSGTILAIKNNQVVLLNNYGNAQQSSTDPIQSTYMIASIQKAITGVLIMKLIENQQLTLETPLSNFYPDIPNSQNITIDQLLSMTSGLILSQKSQATTSKEESIQYAIDNVTYQPLEKWTYSDVNFFFLAAIIEKVSGKTYENYFDEVIKEPLNLQHTGFYTDISENTHLIPSYLANDDGSINTEPATITNSNYINELGTGNMYISAGDLATIIQARVDGNLVSKDVLQKTLIKKDTNYSYSYKAGFYDKTDHYYGHGIFHGYEPSVLFNNDASTMVVFLSNIRTKQKENTDLADSIYQELTQN